MQHNRIDYLYMYINKYFLKIIYFVEMFRSWWYLKQEIFDAALTRTKPDCPWGK